jgi:hypothetical protein
LRAVQAGGQRESRQSPTKIGVGPAAAHCFCVKRLESVLLGFGRIAERAGHIDVFNRDSSARRKKPQEACEDAIRFAHMREQVARVDEGKWAAVKT